MVPVKGCGGALVQGKSTHSASEALRCLGGIAVLWLAAPMESRCDKRCWVEVEWFRRPSDGRAARQAYGKSAFWLVTDVVFIVIPCAKPQLLTRPGRPFW